MEEEAEFLILRERVAETSRGGGETSTSLTRASSREAERKKGGRTACRRKKDDGLYVS